MFAKQTRIRAISADRKQSTRRLCALYGQNNLLVRTLGAHLPDCSEMDDLRGGLVGVIARKVHDSDNLAQIEQEQDEFSAQLPALQYRAVQGYLDWRLAAHARGWVGVFVDYYEEDPRIKQANDLPYVFIPIRAIAAYQSILQVSGESEPLAEQWQSGAEWIMGSLRPAGAGPATPPVQARGFALRQLSVNFEETVKTGFFPPEDLVRAEEVAREMERIDQELHELVGEEYLQKAMEAARTTFAVVGGLPHDQIEALMRGMKRAVRLLPRRERKQLLGAAKAELEKIRISWN